MDNSKRLVSILLLAILLSSVLGWYLGVGSGITENSSQLKQTWKLPSPQTKNLTVYNQQLTELKIWGQKHRASKTMEVIPDWRLVGITNINGVLKALIEVNGELSIKRVSVGELIFANTKLLAISEASITVTNSGNTSEIALYK